MQVSKVAYFEPRELSGADALLEQVGALLRRVCASLGAESCGWLTDISIAGDDGVGERFGLTITRVAADKILLALNTGSKPLSMTKDEMAAVAAYQRAAWTPSLQMWPLTAWSKASSGQLPQTTVCIPLHGPTGTGSIVFIPLGTNVTRWYETALGFVGPLLEAEKELRSVFVPQSPKADPLNPQEIESLKWAAKGKTAWESATIQGIPERTVVQRLKRAREKLGAASTTLAIGIAVQQGFLRHN